MGKPEPNAGPNAAYTIGRTVQLVAFLSGSAAVGMTLFVAGDSALSTAPSLGLALLSGAVFTLGWFIQRHWGRVPRSDR